jgi:Disulphide bond corrector protein DsbC
MKKIYASILVLAPIVAFTLFTLAGVPRALGETPQPIHWTATATTTSRPLSKGSKVLAKITASIAPGWHLYAFEQQPGGPLPTNLSLAEGQPFATAGPIGESTPKTEFDSNFNLSTSIFEDKAVFTVPARVSGAVSASSPKLMVDVAFQTCNDRMCLPLTVVHLTAPIQTAKAH